MRGALYISCHLYAGTLLGEYGVESKGSARSLLFLFVDFGLWAVVVAFACEVLFAYPGGGIDQVPSFVLMLCASQLKSLACAVKIV